MYSVIPLEKSHFRYAQNPSCPSNRCYAGEGVLQVTHPAFRNRVGYVLFFPMWSPHSQDTKTSWFAMGLLRGHVEVHIPEYMRTSIQRCSNTRRFPSIHYVRKDGVVVDARRHDTEYDQKNLVELVCRAAGMKCCGYLPRPNC